jgi:hypothetical protein
MKERELYKDREGNISFLAKLLLIEIEKEI